MFTNMKVAAAALALAGLFALGAMPMTASVAHAQQAPAAGKAETGKAKGQTQKAQKGQSATSKESGCEQFKSDEKRFQDCMKAAGTHGKAAKKPTAGTSKAGEKGKKPTS